MCKPIKKELISVMTTTWRLIKSKTIKLLYAASLTSVRFKEDMALKGSPNITDIAAAVSTARKARHAIMWQSISVRQSKSTKDKGVRGPMWISRVTFPAAGVNNLLGLVTDSISSLGNGESSHKNYRVPPIVQVPAEWVGWRSGVSAKEPEPRMSEQQKYIALTEDATSSLTILYFFGGNF